MQQPSFKVNILEETPNYGKFSLEPLEKGFGHTLGNTLRRILLSDLKGAALTKLKIDGTQHKFTTLKGVKEDLIELTLNLKEVHIAYEGDEPISASLSVKGPKKVTASDINFPPQVHLANPDHYLATLEKGAKLEMQLEIDTGYGYSPAEERKTDVVGEILLDAIFSPVQRVAYDVVQTRVGRRTDFDKLVLEIYTNGTQSPSSLLEQAARIAVSYFSHIYQPSSPQATEKEDKAEDENNKTILVEELGLSTRIVNALSKAGYHTLADLSHATLKDLQAVKNLGEKSIKDLTLLLAEHGIELA